MVVRILSRLVNRFFRSLVLRHRTLCRNFHMTFVTFKFLNAILKLYFLTMRNDTTLFCYALLVTYGVSGAIEKLTLDLNLNLNLVRGAKRYRLLPPSTTVTGLESYANALLPFHSGFESR